MGALTPYDRVAEAWSIAQDALTQAATRLQEIALECDVDKPTAELWRAIREYQVAMAGLSEAKEQYVTWAGTWEK